MKTLIRLSLALAIAALATAGSAATKGSKLPYAIQHHDLRVRLDLLNHELTAYDLVTLKRNSGKAATLELLLRRGLEVKSVRFKEENLSCRILESVDPGRFEAEFDSGDASFYAKAQALQIAIPEAARELPELKLQITYEGAIADSLGGADFSREYVAMQVTGIIDTAGVYLGAEGIYYPTLPEQIFTYNLEVTVPGDYQTVSEGTCRKSDLTGSERVEQWVCDRPVDAFHIVAGKYRVDSIEHGDVKISTYFYPGEADLSKGYLDACEGYIDLYEELLGPYPFSKFAVVDNFFATGYGMPSFTLLGSQVLRLPFIKISSLGHEVCHNWWGNSVYVDYRSGNWCEGLTTYCADYLYKERSSAADAREYRTGLLRDYVAYTHEANDFPLKEFRERHNPAQRAVGYGKSAMIYHMLRNSLGEDVFWRTLRRFYKEQIWKFASWKDLRSAFEAETNQNLGWFFDQWVNRTGAPRLLLESVRKEKSANGWTISFSLSQTQEGAPYKLEIPAVILGGGQDSDQKLIMTQARQFFRLNVPFDPASLSIDPNFDIFRRPDKTELAPTLAELFGAEQLLIVLPNQASVEIQKAYRDMAESLKSPGDGYRVVTEAELAPADLSKYAVLFLGSPMENKAIPTPWLGSLQWKISETGFSLLGKDYAESNGIFVAVERNPENGELVVGYLCARQASDLPALGRRIKHYGKYSYLAFKGNENVAKGTWEPSDSPLAFRFPK